MNHALIRLREELRELHAQYGALSLGSVTAETTLLLNQTAREIAETQQALDWIGEGLVAMRDAA